MISGGVDIGLGVAKGVPDSVGLFLFVGVRLRPPLIIATGRMSCQSSVTCRKAILALIVLLHLGVNVKRLKVYLWLCSLTVARQ